MVKISIIIPVYNTPEKYIRRALDSIWNNDLSACEVIAIDDGSNEEVGANLDFLSSVYDDFRIVHSVHKGLSAARNLGIKEAKGEYLLFVDADDELGLNCLSEAKKIIETQKSDVVYGRIRFIPEQHYKQDRGNTEIFKSRDVHELLKCIYNEFPRKLDFQIITSACGRLYKTELVKKVWFDENVALFEDYIFNREILQIANNVIVHSGEWYLYYRNNFSMTHKDINIAYLSSIDGYWRKSLQLDKKEAGATREFLRKQALSEFYVGLKRECLSTSAPIKSKIKIIKEICAHPYIKDAVNNLRISSKQLGTRQKIGLFLLKIQSYYLVYFLQYCMHFNELKDLREV